jgi:hypothetical protein
MEDVVGLIQRLSWRWFVNSTTKSLCLLYEWVWNPGDCMLRWEVHFGCCCMTGVVVSAGDWCGCVMWLLGCLFVCLSVSCCSLLLLVFSCCCLLFLLLFLAVFVFGFRPLGPWFVSWAYFVLLVHFSVYQ